MSKPPPSTYAERLEYGRWVRALTAGGGDESDQDLIRRSGVKQSWFSKWRNSKTPPPRHVELAPLAAALGVTMDFLLGGGAPPLPGLWADWLSARRGEPVPASDPRYVGSQPSAAPDYTGGRHLTTEEVTRARAVRDAEQASTTAAAKKPERKANGRKRG